MPRQKTYEPREPQPLDPEEERGLLLQFAGLNMRDAPEDDLKEVSEYEEEQRQARLKSRRRKLPVDPTIIGSASF